MLTAQHNKVPLLEFKSVLAVAALLHGELHVVRVRRQRHGVVLALDVGAVPRHPAAARPQDEEAADAKPGTAVDPSWSLI